MLKCLYLVFFKFSPSFLLEGGDHGLRCNFFFFENINRILFCKLIFSKDGVKGICGKHSIIAVQNQNVGYFEFLEESKFECFSFRIFHEGSFMGFCLSMGKVHMHSIYA